MTGRIHSFQSLGTADGPGVRAVVFMQGCPLRCACCHNPDTWDFNGGKEATPEEIFARRKELKEMGLEVPLSAFIAQKLIDLGYVRYDLIDGRGQFSVRGGIVDISITEKTGLRIEFWGDTVDSIKNNNNIYTTGKVVKVNDYIIEVTGLNDVTFYEEVNVDDKASGYVFGIYSDRVIVALVNIFV